MSIASRVSRKPLHAAGAPRACLAIAVAAWVVAGLAACAATPERPAGAVEARQRLDELQSNPDLAGRAPAAMKDAELAVRAAEMPQTDPEVGTYYVYLADRKVDIARARAQTALAEDQRLALTQQRDQSRLDARTQEADAATNKLAAARANLAESTQQNADLQKELEDMHARATDRGMVLTLGDLLFTIGKADLKSGATDNLDRLVTFLNNYPNRSLVIEGYTDNTGNADYNLGLSERRAASVKSYLASQGIVTARLSATGKGESDPVADNDSAAGRQQNRRVEVIIIDPAPAQRR